MRQLARRSRPTSPPSALAAPETLGTHAGVTFQRERLAPILREILPLIERDWLENGVDRDKLPLRLDLPKYLDYDLTANSAQCFIQPRFTPWDISVAINDELKALTTPKSGIGQILTSDQTFIPVYMGYDLGSSFDPVRSRVLEITFALPAPMRQNPLIRRGEYRVIRATNQPGIFPSGNGVLIYRDAFVGFPIHITQLAPFQPLVNLTDSLQTVAGVPIYMEDIVEFGAVLRLAPDREIQRNSLAFQRDPRKAAEVPASAQMHSIDALQRRYQSRLDDEAANIKYAYKQSEGF